MTGKGIFMTQTYTARTWKEGDLFIAQCAEVDVASHGQTEEEALVNLREALELYFEPPTAAHHSKSRTSAFELM
jgi:predicted RNase H-like HicB family nuclease